MDILEVAFGSSYNHEFCNNDHNPKSNLSLWTNYCFHLKSGISLPFLLCLKLRAPFLKIDYQIVWYTKLGVSLPFSPWPWFLSLFTAMITQFSCYICIFFSVIWFTSLPSNCMLCLLEVRQCKGSMDEGGAACSTRSRVQWCSASITNSGLAGDLF